MKTKQVSYLKVDRREVEKTVREFYKQDFECVASEEWFNGAKQSYSVKKEPLANWEQESLDKFKAREDYSFILKILLTDMCNNNVIEPGDYLITADW